MIDIDNVNSDRSKEIYHAGGAQSVLQGMGQQSSLTNLLDKM